jgi:hypothetical protein
MRLTLVQPPNGLYDYYDLAPPLGLLTIAAAVEEDGIDVSLVDMNLRGMQDRTWVQEDFYRNAIRAISETNPDVVGFTSMGLESHVCLEIARQLKAVAPDVITVLGGPHFTTIAREVVELYPWIDYVVTGDGEVTTRRLLMYLKGKARAANLVNVAYQDGNSVKLVRALKQEGATELPWPAYHLVNLSEYFALNPLKLLDYEHGRGCIFRCAFCYSPVHWGQGDRPKEIDHVVEEVIRLRDMGARHLFFVQDNFLNSKPAAKALCNALIEARADITWNCYGTLPQLTPDILDILSAAGCRAIFTGVDAVSPEAQRAFGKHFFKGWSQLEEKLEGCLQRGIVPTCAFMVDIPELDHVNTDATLNTALMARNLGCGMRLNTLTLYNQTSSAIEKKDYPKTYTELKPRLLFDTPNAVAHNPYAQEHPELFPFHNTYLPLPLYTRFVTGMHIAYTLFTSFPRTLLQYVVSDNGSLWELLERVGSHLDNLVEIPPIMRRPVERELFQQIFPRLPVSQATKDAFAMETAELQLGRNDAESTVMVQTEERAEPFRCGKYELVTLSHDPKILESTSNAGLKSGDPSPYLLVRQGRRIRYFAVSENVAHTVDRIRAARRSGATVDIQPHLLTNLVRTGVLQAHT